MSRISLSPSRRLALLLCLAHGGAAGAALAAVALPLWLRVLLLLFIGGSCGMALYGPALMRGKSSIVALELGDDARVAFQTRNGDWREGRVLGSSFVAPYLTVLNIRTEESPFARHVVILKDSIDAEAFRELRVRLRWQGRARA
jgi:toxin CptA